MPSSAPPTRASAAALTVGVRLPLSKTLDPSLWFDRPVNAPRNADANSVASLASIPRHPDAAGAEGAADDDTGRVLRERGSVAMVAPLATSTGASTGCHPHRCELLHVDALPSLPVTRTAEASARLVVSSTSCDGPRRSERAECFTSTSAQISIASAPSDRRRRSVLAASPWMIPWSVTRAGVDVDADERGARGDRDPRADSPSLRSTLMPSFVSGAAARTARAHAVMAAIVIGGTRPA